ncbi:MAG: hypothetical protein IT315_10065 [Anaerolineales bacterium]|nr:hypothetical protein [Anaerolineales bacterium]
MEIPLSDGRKAFGRYLHRDSQMGPILQVYDLILKNREEVNLETLKVTNDLFKPVFVGIGAAVRSGIWKIIGYLPVENFAYPGFLWPSWSGDPPIVYRWSFWDGTKSIPLGTKLPEEYKKYEYIGGYAAPDIAKRIKTGEESFVKKLIAGERKDEPAA